ncbi:hypothetical protein Tco_0053112 [Tanacetum coccineum]
MGDENSICTLGDYSKPSHEGYRNTIELPVGNNVVPLRSDTIRRTIDQSASGKLRDRNAKESWALLEDLVLYDNESWNDPRDFAKPVKAIALPQDVPMVPTTYSSKQAFVEYASLRTDEVGGKRFTPNQGPRNFNDAIDTWKDKLNFNWGRTQTFTSPQNGSISTHSSIYQMKLERALLDFDSHQERKLSHLRTQLEQQYDDMIGKINLIWKTIFKKLNDVSTLENAGNSMASKSIAAISQVKREELRKKGIKSPSKLFSLKYRSPTSIKELKKNLSAPKRVHFVNSIVVLSKDSDTDEDDVSSTNACEHDLESMVRRKEEAKEQCKEEDEMGTAEEVEELFKDKESEKETEEEVEEVVDDETEEEEDDDIKYYNSPPTIKELVYHEWLLENPQPSWVKAKIRVENPSNTKIWTHIQETRLHRHRVPNQYHV